MVIFLTSLTKASAEYVDLKDGSNENARDIIYLAFRYLLDIGNNINRQGHHDLVSKEEKLPMTVPKHVVHHRRIFFLISFPNNKKYFL